MFDIKDFYHSIKEKLTWETKRFAKSYISISSKDIETIFHGRKSFLYYNDNPSVKKVERNFDVTMGPYDRAEICELIDFFYVVIP